MGCLEFGSAQTGSCCGGKTTAFTSCGCGKITTTIGTRTPNPRRSSCCERGREPSRRSSGSGFARSRQGLVTPPYSAFRWQQAHQDSEKALGLDANSNEARIGLAYVLGGKLSDEWSPVLQEDPRRAEQLLVEVLDRGDTANQMAAAHFELGLVHQMQNRLAKAQREFRLSIALELDNPRAHLHLGEALLYLGDPECALFEQAVRFSSDGDPILPINYWALGTCHMLLGETDKAIVLLQKARAANDHIWVPYFYLAGAYGLKGDLTTRSRPLQSR
jgi:tetratricopeptide (TPR) repeat protein